jgi:ABC-type Zn uptake system ZnuABC Zn-binding protein ZnuA
MLKHITRLIALVALASSMATVRAAAAIDVVATTEDLASIVKEVGGDKVKVEAIAAVTRIRISSSRSRASF